LRFSIAAYLCFQAIRPESKREIAMTLGTILLIVLLLLLVGALPVHTHSRSWGYYPAGGLTTALIVVLVLIFMGAI
jgi:hypothetical protein